MAIILSPIVLSWCQKFAWSTDEIAVEKWLGVIPYDCRVSMRRSWSTDDKFDTPLPEYGILHKTAGAGNIVSRGLAGRHQNCQNNHCILQEADLGECMIGHVWLQHSRRAFSACILGMVIGSFCWREDFCLCRNAALTRKNSKYRRGVR
jgi:hypothetical protein